MTAPSDFRAYLRILWRWKILFVTLLVGVPAIAFAAVSRESKSYQSTVLLQESPSNVDTSFFVTGSGLVRSGTATANGTTLGALARIIETPPYAGAAAKLLHPPPKNPGSLLRQIKAVPDTTTGFINITATAGSPTRAADIANAFGQAVEKLRAQQAVNELTSQIDRLNLQLARLHGPNAGVERVQLSQELQTVVALRAAQGKNAQILQAATPDPSPISPKTTKVVGLALIVGFLLALGAVVLAEAADRRIRNPEDLEELTDLPLLSVIPRGAFTTSVGSGAREGEAFQMLRSALTFFNVDRSLSTVLIGSPVKGDGKTTVATHLAMAIAQGGRNVLLVDADLRWPQAEARLGLTGEAVSPGHGLTAVLTDQVSLSEALVDVPLHGEEEHESSTRANRLHGQLRLLPGGGPVPNPSGLLASHRMREVLDQCTRMADLVIIDTTPLLSVSDSIALLDFVSGVVLVARLNGTSKDAIRRFMKTISNTSATVLGAVATGAAAGGLYARYGYGYYGYGYGYGAGYTNGNGNGNGSRRFRLPERRKRESKSDHSV
jgi:capsular exopolysaccharide synthesis family protein